MTFWERFGKRFGLQALFRDTRLGHLVTDHRRFHAFVHATWCRAFYHTRVGTMVASSGGARPPPPSQGTTAFHVTSVFPPMVPVAGAVVKLTGISNNATNSVSGTTDGNGLALITIAPGVYDWLITAQGFQTAKGSQPLPAVVNVELSSVSSQAATLASQPPISPQPLQAPLPTIATQGPSPQPQVVTPVSPSRTSGGSLRVFVWGPSTQLNIMAKISDVDTGAVYGEGTTPFTIRPNPGANHTVILTYPQGVGSYKIGFNSGPIQTLSGGNETISAQLY